ncbi:MAG TPA: hypothetical protein VNS12_13695 [Pelagibacterium sp.]|uniref:hypothetical protein n=1 Tax=Pelagibacterium sp. TaxID=1967288 RepID=UPI002B79761A|nr:hypothetical protein [Pelagibacterium sp.]HWJ89116.1 hypothetical protein [Pelagibacterium sp.]
MSRPGDIPQDVLQQARAVFVAISGIEDAADLLRVASGEFDDAPMLSIAARAILAERERCANIVDEEIEQAREFGPHHIPVLSAAARAIRTGAAHG